MVRFCPSSFHSLLCSLSTIGILVKFVLLYAFISVWGKFYFPYSLFRYFLLRNPLFHSTFCGEIKIIEQKQIKITFKKKLWRKHIKQECLRTASCTSAVNCCSIWAQDGRTDMRMQKHAEFHNLYSSPNMITAVIFGGMRDWRCI